MWISNHFHFESLVNALKNLNNLIEIMCMVEILSQYFFPFFGKLRYISLTKTNIINFKA